jgi:hypothetical protein
MKGTIVTPWENLVNFVKAYLDARRIYNIENGRSYQWSGQASSDAFWQSIQALNPDWEQGRAWIA